MTTIQVELPDSTVQAAQAAGLLNAEVLDRLLTDALRREQAANWLLSIADRTATAGIAPMSVQEINAEVKAFRTEKREQAQKAAGNAGSH